MRGLSPTYFLISTVQNVSQLYNSGIATTPDRTLIDLLDHTRQLKACDGLAQVAMNVSNCTPAATAQGSQLAST